MVANCLQQKAVALVRSFWLSFKTVDEGAVYLLLAISC